MDPKDVRHVGVVGCGLMGSGIVEVLARAGADVTYVEGTDELVARGRASIERSVGKAVERGKLDPVEGEAALGRIRGVTDLHRLDGSDLVIEAATEDVEAKLAIFRTLGEVTRADVVLASNTSSIPIVELAVASGRPEHVIGMHFFNPPPVMAFVRVTLPSSRVGAAKVKAELDASGTPPTVRLFTNVVFANTATSVVTARLCSRTPSCPPRRLRVPNPRA